MTIHFRSFAVHFQLFAFCWQHETSTCWSIASMERMSILETQKTRLAQRKEHSRAESDSKRFRNPSDDTPECLKNCIFAHLPGNSFSKMRIRSTNHLVISNAVCATCSFFLFIFFCFGRLFVIFPKHFV